MKHWTEQEDEQLYEAGIIPVKRLAMNLGRTYKAVKNRMSRLGISVYHNFYSARLLAKELGRHNTTVMQWYNKGWLKGKRATWGRGFYNSPMIFTDYGIEAFIKKHYDLFDYRKIPNHYFSRMVERITCEEEDERFTV